MLVPERGEPTTKIGLLILLCILVECDDSPACIPRVRDDRLYNQCAIFARVRNAIWKSKERRHAELSELGQAGIVAID
jgi:hypothetical protein